MHRGNTREQRRADLDQRRWTRKPYYHRIVGGRVSQSLRDNPRFGPVCSDPDGRESAVHFNNTSSSSTGAPQVETTEGEGAARDSYTVAVIDDDAAVCDSTRILLEALDYE